MLRTQAFRQKFNRSDKQIEQLLRYMVCIWNEYAKEMEKQKKGNRSQKDFKYPPVIPVVHYEGAERWTAPGNLKERIAMSDELGDYIPDFSYKLIRTQDYSNEELLSKDNEMSFFMMLNKIQTVQELTDFIAADRLQIKDIVENTTKSIRDIMAVVLWNLLIRMNAPLEEAEKCIEYFKEGNMGNWFENMEKMDIQVERRNTAEARAQVVEVKKQAIISSYQDFHASKEATIEKLIRECEITKEEAEEAIEKFWK